ncbi:MAG: hypothetical protein QXO70_04530 [Candidatus Pacearchaeota archaeon]
MNPSNVSQLDPKLREAYERVMGTSIPHSSPASTTVSTHNETTSAPQNQNQVVIGKKKEGPSPILIAIALLLFFIIYTLIWIMVFGVKIPFLP